MPYALRSGLSFCEIDGQLVFLDIENDRYFRLSESVQRSFMSYLASKDACTTCAACLVENGILAESTVGSNCQGQAFEYPSSSAIELAHSRAKISLRSVLEVSATVFWTKLQLETRGLRNVLLSLAKCREKAKQESSSLPKDPSGISDLLKAVSAFKEARILVPVETRCLLDSLAIVRFLARRNLQANIVIGVTGDPFSAHCWAQHHDIVLNDTVGNVRSFTPIRVI